MFKRRISVAALAAVLSCSLIAAPALADPGNGHGGGHPGNSGHHGNKGHGKHSQAGKPDQINVDISFSRARSLAVNHGLVGYQALPPGIAKNLARGKPLPPGIAKKTLPASMIRDLPYYPGYEWRAVGDDLVLIALSTAVVTAIINGVFD